VNLYGAKTLKKADELFVEWLLPRINGAYVIYEGVKLFMITLLFFRHYIQNVCILRNRLINFVTVNLNHSWASLWYYNHHSRGAVGVMWLFHFVSLGVRLQSRRSSIFWTRVKINHKFGIPDPNLPIHYTTFIELRWQFRALYSCTTPLLSVESKKKTKSNFDQNFDSFAII